jgi:hypothetical protein
MNNTQPNNPTVYVVMHNLVILGAYSRPEWAAHAVLKKLEEEHIARTQRAVEFKLQMPDGVYLLRAGYDEADEFDLVYHPTLEQIEQTITERANFMGVTVAGIGSSTYALNIIPVVMDA